MPDRPTYRPVYKALHRPLTVCGVDRRLFFLALLLGAATFNLFYSFLAGLLMFLRPVRVRVVGHASRPGDAADSPRFVEDAAPLRPGQARTVRRRGGVVLKRETHPSGLRRRRQRQQPAFRSGASSMTRRS